MVAGQLWLAQISVSSSYAAAILPGLLLTSLGIGLALPTASIAITTGVQGRDQGLAGALFTTGQQTGAAVGLAVLATVATARTEHESLNPGVVVSGERLREPVPLPETLEQDRVAADLVLEFAEQRRRQLLRGNVGAVVADYPGQGRARRVRAPSPELPSRSPRQATSVVAGPAIRRTPYGSDHAGQRRLGPSRRHGQPERA